MPSCSKPNIVGKYCSIVYIVMSMDSINAINHWNAQTAGQRPILKPIYHINPILSSSLRKWRTSTTAQYTACSKEKQLVQFVFIYLFIDYFTLSWVLIYSHSTVYFIMIPYLFTLYYQPIGQLHKWLYQSFSFSSTSSLMWDLVKNAATSKINE